MNISNYFVVFYLKGRPIDSFDFSKFSDSYYYINPCIKNGKYICFNVYSYDDHLYMFDIPQHDYYIYWPKSLLKLYNRLVFNCTIKSPSLSSFCRYDNKFQNHLRYFANPRHKIIYHCKFMDKFRKRFKAIIVMK